MKKPQKILIVFLDWALLNGAFILSILIKRNRIFLNAEYGVLLLLYNLFWLVSFLFSRKYSGHRPRNIIDGFRSSLRAFAYLSFLVFFSIFLLKLFVYSRQIILVTLFIYLLLSIIFYFLYYLIKWGPATDVFDEEDVLARQGLSEATVEDKIVDSPHRKIRDSLRKNFLNKSNDFSKCPKLTRFLDASLRLDGIRAANSIFFNTSSYESIDGLLSGNWEIIGNISPLNKLPNINRFLISLNNKLVPGGYYVGIAETIKQRIERKYSRFPRILRRGFSFLDFCWMRVFPKVQGLKVLYFTIHGKGGWVLSDIEIMGRLVYCGFKIIKTEEIDKNLWFLAKKIRTPLDDKHPSYSMVFKQKRVGQNRRLIEIFKFRTMYPYSEYLSKYFIAKNKLGPLAKVQNDPRITGWGRIMRRLWLDELPMLVNFLQGDLKLVGVRPVSRSFFDLYPEKLKMERLKYKPGVFPPYYAEMSREKEELYNSEWRYFSLYRKHPLRTDFVYFFKILFNVVFKKARSA